MELHNKRICIFSSSSSLIDKLYFKAAYELSERLAQKDTLLVFGGGKLGLMGECAMAYKKNKAQVIAVIPEKLATDELLYKEYDKIYTTKTLNERKEKMENISDVFIALPGGFGTLEEIMEQITLKQLGYHQKPIALLNTDGFYNHLEKHLEVFYKRKFAREKCRKLYYIASNPDQIIDYLFNFKETIFDEIYY